jgi:ribosome-binding ATPase YchF (GTP1/OBG family)
VTADVAALVAAMPDPAAETELRRQLAREAYELGHSAGWREGREALLREQELAARVATGLIEAIAAGPTFAEMEARRWTVRGEPRTRSAFGEPHPDDFTGLESA